MAARLFELEPDSGKQKGVSCNSFVNFLKRYHIATLSRLVAPTTAVSVTKTKRILRHQYGRRRQGAFSFIDFTSVTGPATF
ncbi:hypothetical protein LSTR_LSTR007389 [Laodelphax striatellus]|uniref:Uncharacterized protein n=1 Tax=Laodelphax striatellus TaxID=195883 RepID=A0A482XNL8_LAOST|nr:hypothetical protein LSTR_LSTR007389 [Laodelphax striatellus]